MSLGDLIIKLNEAVASGDCAAAYEIEQVISARF